MTDRIEINYEALTALQLDLLRAASQLSEVANGAYLSGGVFPESVGRTPVAADQCLASLGQAATSMFQILTAGAAYFGRVIEGFNQWDQQQADTFIGALATYQQRIRDTRDAPVNQPR